MGDRSSFLLLIIISRRFEKLWIGRFISGVNPHDLAVRPVGDADRISGKLGMLIDIEEKKNMGAPHIILICANR